MRSKVSESLEGQQAAVAGTDLLLFQHPGMLVRDENGAQACFKSRVDVRLRAVPDHPRALRVEPALLDQGAVRGSVFLLDNRRVRKPGAEARAIDLQLLLLRMAF